VVVDLLSKRFRELCRGRGLRAELIRGGVGSIAVKAANVGLMFAVTVLLARVLGPGGYGLYAFAFAVATLLTVLAQEGMLQLTVRETAKAFNSQDWPLLKGLWIWSTRNVVLVAGALVGVVAASLWLAQPWIQGPRVVTLATALSLVPLLALTRVWDAAVRGLGRVVIGQLPDLVLRPAALIALVAVWVSAGSSSAISAPTAMGLHAAATGVALAVGAWLLWRSAPSGINRAGADWRAVPDWRRAAFPLVLIGGLQMINTQADILMLGLLRSDEEVGIYRVVVQMATLVVFGLYAINQIVQHHFARLYQEGDLRRMQALATRTAQTVTGFALIPVILFIALGGPLLGILFGEEYKPGAAPLGILAVGQLLNAAMGSVVMILNMTGHERDTVGAVGAGAAANIALNLVLIPPYGAMGAAIATATTLIIWKSLLVRTVYRRVGVVSMAARLDKLIIR